MSERVAFPGNVFPLGTHVYREPHRDVEDTLSDLRILARLGFNMIKIQESWSADEPREGEVDLWRIERIISRARELGLGIYLGLTMEQAPAWMWRKHPDCRLVYASGLPHNDSTQYLLPSDGKPGPCWDHPGAREAGERFIAQLARRLGRFDNIWAWNTWQEIGFWPNEGGVLGFCYCPHTLRLFREWLREKYGTLEAMNRTWQSAFGDWDEVEPPRRMAAVPIFVDWRWFMDNVYLVRALEWKTRALRENDPGGRPVFSHVATPTIGSGSVWRWAAAGDFFANSNYPAWWSVHHWDDNFADRAQEAVSGFQEMWEGVMLRTDYVRSATGRGRTMWGAEFQGGPISTYLHRGRDPKAADIRRWMLSGLAAGMHGISFWNHRCELFWSECNGFGLLDPQGDTTERIEEAARIGRAVNEDPEVFSLGDPPRADVAILIHEGLYHFCQATQNDALGHLQYGIRGHYRRLWEMGVSADFVEAAEVAEGVLKHYRVAVLPMPLALGGEWFAHLAEFVRGGGMLISDACPGRFEPYGYCPTGQMVAGGEELFGARHAGLTLVGEPSSAPRWTPGPRGFGEIAPAAVLRGTGMLEGAFLRASFYLQTLAPTTARAILMAGDQVAGTCNQAGSGRAVLIGTFAGHSATAHRLEGEEGVFERLLAAADVRPDRCGPLLRRRRVHGRRQAWFLINPSNAEVTTEVSLEGFTQARDLLGDAVTERRRTSVVVRVPAVNACCLLLS